jgi:hypothetical protein
MELRDELCDELFDILRAYCLLTLKSPMLTLYRIVFQGMNPALPSASTI